MKKLNTFLGGIFMVLMVTVSIATLGAVPVPQAFAGTLAVSSTLSVIKYYNPIESGLAHAGVLKELWTGELMKAFRAETGWISELRNESRYVNNDVIHLVDVGTDPAVLINNAAYPIPAAGRTDTDIAISLDKFDTENTIITDDELYAISYDKIKDVIEQHKLTLTEQVAEYGLFNLCVNGNTANTPVLETTGTLEGIYRMLTITDLRLFKQRLDALKIPKVGRVMILSSLHANHLLASSQVFRDLYHNTKTGEVLNFMGFKFYESVQTPLFDGTTKASFGATPADPRDASVFIFAPRAFKAMGTLKMYWDKAENNPRTRQTELGFQVRSLMLPKKNLGFGAIISGLV